MSLRAPSRGEIGWIAPLAATLAVQTTAAFLTRVVPTVAPALTRELDLPGGAVGYLSAVGTAGSIVFLVAGAPLMRRTGPIRALQIGLVAGAAGIALAALPVWPALVLASVLIGLGYAPSAPAGTDVLQRHAPARHRNLIFSIKQAGVPIGGVLAGLLLPPVAEAAGWRAALVLAMGLVVLTVALVQPLRAAIDVDADPTVRLGARAFLSLENLARPIAAVRASPALRRMALVGACLSVGQGCWSAFLVTYAVERLGMSLTGAGLLFAVMQGTGVAGRVLLGWASDRTGSGRLILAAVTVGSALTSAALALTDPTWSLSALVALAAVGGITVASWNGVQVAELASLAPRGGVSEASSGGTVLIFLGYVAGPAFFAALVQVTGRYDAGFWAVAAATLGALLGLRPRSPAGRTRPTGSS